MEVTCPGKFYINCPEDDIGDDFKSDMCDCDGELLISADCRHGFYCYENTANGGWNLTCPEGEIIKVNIRTYNWGCREDDGQCPGLGGFKVGCEDGAPPVRPPDLNCTFTKNPLGDCGDCSNQIFVSEDCKESFYCTEYAEEGTDGCHMVCEDDEIVFLDVENKKLTCVDEPEGIVCPGAFSLDCPGDDGGFDIQCGCEHEVWMREDCRTAFFCTEPMDEEGKNVGYQVHCPVDEIVEISFFDSSLGHSCTKNKAKCPGAFHFGCNGGDLDFSTSTSMPSTVQGSTPDPNSSDRSSVELRGVLLSFLSTVIVFSSL